ncbi:uncharacterized protein si:ch73-95l15.5 isoform X1 [Synchiropus splendidus]|uniref:uncharacterized protein si:ch73-95l15.5 isoform X1 n=1 Tax=Synchiropus splendidus TaxID=270530 RepID=UPI00237E7E3C|nr:uncharacterized protein si:ch73-95l15.5 isoform X1 [Synchiropus splendidus]
MMSSRAKHDLCRICGGTLQGNQRRWLFGAQHRKSQTPIDSMRGGSLSRSTRSSPWGSTLSLSSSGSLSKSQSSLNSTAKGIDVLAVLTHILGQSVSRGSGKGEFVCGKCITTLERVFKFDSVIARVKVLSSERLQKLLHERDKLRQWVRNSYQQKNHQDFKNRESVSDDEADAVKEGYREMLRDNMSLSEYECWSEKWDTCPYFIKTGKRCRKGKGCEGCDSLRVSDSDYESVCGIPRRLPAQSFSPSPLCRDKSQSMPLHWQRVSSSCSSPTSLAGSSFSFRASSVAESAQSLDSLDGEDPFDSPADQAVHFVLHHLRFTEGKPINSPSGSRIPILAKREGRNVSRVLSFETVGNGVDKSDEEDGDVLSELRDEFMPLHRENTSGRVQHAVRHLRSQLDQALAKIRHLEFEQKHGKTNLPEVNGFESWNPEVLEKGGSSVLLSLSHSLRSRERLIQECMGLIRRLCLEEGGGAELADKLTEKLMENLKDTLSDNKTVLDHLVSELTEKEKNMQKEIESLKKAGRDREKDLDMLNVVLLCNQDVINDLRVTATEKEQLLSNLEKEREVWSQRDRAHAAVLQEKEELIHVLKEELQSSQRDAQVLSESLIGQASAGGGAEAALASQLKERENRITSLLKDRELNGATMCQEVTKLTTVLQEYQAMVQTQQVGQAQTQSSLSAKLRDTQQELREREKQKKEVERAWHNDREERQREERKLRDSLDKRDKLIEQILLDAEERDHLFRELQQNLQRRHEAVKHTL